MLVMIESKIGTKLVEAEVLAEPEHRKGLEGNDWYFARYVAEDWSCLPEVARPYCGEADHFLVRREAHPWANPRYVLFQTVGQMVMN